MTDQHMVTLTLTLDEFMFVHAACASLAMTFGEGIGKMKPDTTGIVPMMATTACELAGWETVDNLIRCKFHPLSERVAKVVHDA